MDIGFSLVANKLTTEFQNSVAEGDGFSDRNGDILFWRGKWRAGGGDGIKNPSLSETDFPSLIATDYKIRRPTPEKKILSRRLSVAVFIFFKIKLLVFDQIRTYKSFPARNLQDLHTQSTSNGFEAFSTISSHTKVEYHIQLDLSVRAGVLNTGQIYLGSGKIRVGCISG